MDPKVEIRSLRDRCRALEETTCKLENEQRVLKERLEILSKQLYREVFGAEKGNAELEARQADIEEWARDSEEYS
jgi:hypothetical protein